MTEYIVSEDVLLDAVRQTYGASKENSSLHIMKGISGTEITRCRDCECYEFYDEIFYDDGEEDQLYRCTRFGYISPHENDFCAWARRKE